MAIQFLDMFAGIGGFRSRLKDGRLHKIAGNAVSVSIISDLGQKIKEIYYGQEKR